MLWTTAVFLAASSATAPTHSAYSPLANGSMLPEIKAEHFLNATSSPTLASLRGKVALVVLFDDAFLLAPQGNAPDAVSFPSDLKKQVGNGPVPTIGLILGTTAASEERIRRFSTAMKIDYPLVWGPAIDEIEKQHPIRRTPEFWIVGADGKISWSWNEEARFTPPERRLGSAFLAWQEAQLDAEALSRGIILPPRRLTADQELHGAPQAASLELKEGQHFEMPKAEHWIGAPPAPDDLPIFVFTVMDDSPSTPLEEDFSLPEKLLSKYREQGLHVVALGVTNVYDRGSPILAVDAVPHLEKWRKEKNLSYPIAFGASVDVWNHTHSSLGNIDGSACWLVGRGGVVVRVSNLESAENDPDGFAASVSRALAKVPAH